MPYEGTISVDEFRARNPRAYNYMFGATPNAPGSNLGTLHEGYSALSARGAGMSARLGSSSMGRALKIGTAESFGWHFEGSMWATKGLKNQGFLGIRGGLQELQRIGPQDTTSIFPRNKMMTPQQATKAGAGKIFQRGLRGAGAKAVGKFAASTAFKAIPLVGTAAYAYMGYQQEGLWGAAKGVAESIAWQVAPRAIGAIGLGPAAPIVATVAAAYGAQYAVGTLAKSHVRQLRDLELGGGQVVDALSSAGAATMRQRSLSALQNTHVNGRMAMGNEALLMHTPFR